MVRYHSTYCFFEYILRQRQLEEDRQEKLKQLLESKQRQKREKEENKLRRIQLAESCEYFESEIYKYLHS